MADPVTPAKGFTLPTVGGDTGVWGGYTNNNWGLLDTVLGGTVAVTISGNTLLTSTQTQNTGFNIVGSLGSIPNVLWPSFSGLVVIENNTTGGFSISCGISGGGLTILVASGTVVPVWSDGTNFLPLAALPGGAPETGTGPLVLQNSPEIITPAVSGFITLQGNVSGASVLTAPVSGGGTIVFPAGSKTLADTLLDNVTLTGDVINTGLTTQVVSLGHVTNASLANTALASGYLSIGSTTISLGGGTSGVSGLTGLAFALGGSVANTVSGLIVSGVGTLYTSGAASIYMGTGSSINVTGTTVNLSGSSLLGTGTFVISGVTTLAMSGAAALSLQNNSTVTLGSGTTITGSGLVVSGVSTINGLPLEGPLFQSTLPLLLAPTGTMAASGHVTFGTALPFAYANAYAYFPSGAIVSGASGTAAGWYYLVCSSTVSGQVYNNTYTNGQPTIPASPTAFSTPSSGAYTGTVTGQTAYQFTIPVGAVTPRATLRLVAGMSTAATSGNKSVSGVYGGTSFLTYSEAASGVSNIYASMDLATNENSATQYAIWNVTAGSSGSAINGVGRTYGSVASGAQTFSINLQMGLPSDFVVLEHAVLELIKGP